MAFTPPKAVTPPVAAPPTATAAGRVSCNGNSTSGLRRNQHLTNRAKNRNEERYKEPTTVGIAGETKFFGRDYPVSVFVEHQKICGERTALEYVRSEDERERREDR